MLELARRSDEDRADIIMATAFKMGMNEAIIEKDFWVCWILEMIFHHSKYFERLAFKGGTSLSKGYGIIERFSEDVDLILDWRTLGYKLNEPWNERSNSKQNQFNNEINQKTEIFLKEILMPHFNDIINNQGIVGFKLYIDESDLKQLGLYILNYLLMKH
jgi:hypothetical protein